MLFATAQIYQIFSCNAKPVWLNGCKIILLLIIGRG